jgi:peptide-methionine (S)-S-oxide reductase
MSQSIIFGGGCFWCVEAVFKMLKGVDAVTSGYTGGDFPNPTYEDICTGKTGHAEVVKIEYNPNIVDLETLLAVFFTSHDPTTPNQQGNDHGPQYRSVIFFNTPEQKEIVENYIQKLTAEQTFAKPIITQVLPLEKFYPAEAYHQDYYTNNQTQPYCQIVIDPKIIKLKKTL